MEPLWSTEDWDQWEISEAPRLQNSRARSVFGPCKDVHPGDIWPVAFHVYGNRWLPGE